MTSSSPEPRQKLHPIRVLFIVDSIYWVISNFFLHIKDNPKLEGRICSYFTLRKTIKRFGEFTSSFDLMHILRQNPIKPFEGNYPIVSTLHHVDSGTKLSLLDASDSVMTVSTEWYNYLIKMGLPSKKLGIVPFGIDSQVFHPPDQEERLQIRRSLNVSKEAFLIGFSARRTSDSDKRKGIRCFVQALKLVNQQLPHVATVIIGPGWQQLARELETEGIACSLIPYHIDHEQIAKFYRTMDVFWTTARIEGGPIPLLEAMASGIPCISTPVGIALDLIKDAKNGFIVPFDSPEKFASLSIQLQADKELRKRLGMEARNTILRERTWSQSQQKMLDLYERTLNNFKCPSFQKRAKDSNDHRAMKALNTSEVFQPEKTEFFPPRIEKWMAACEHLNGLRMVLEMGEWRASIQIGYRAIKIAPFDHCVWLEFFKILKKQLKKKKHQRDKIR